MDSAERMEDICCHCKQKCDDSRRLPCQHISCLRCLDELKLRPRRLQLRVKGSFKVKCPACKAKHNFMRANNFPTISSDSSQSVTPPPAAVASAAVVIPCDSHPVNDTEKFCDDHQTLVCKTCILYQHRKCQLKTVMAGEESLRCRLRSACVALGERKLVSACFAVRISGQRVQNLQNATRFALDQTTEAPTSEGYAVEEDVATKYLLEALQIWVKRYQVHVAPIEMEVEKLSRLCRQGNDILSQEGYTASFFTATGQLLKEINSALNANSKTAVAWSGPLGFEFEHGVVTEIYDNGSVDAEATMLSASDQSNSVCSAEPSLEEEAKQMEILKADNSEYYQESIHVLLVSLAAHKVKVKSGTTSDKSAASKSYQDQVQQDVLRQQEKHDQQQKQTRQTVSKQHEHLQTQGQRADDLLRERKERQELQKKQLLEQRKEQQTKQEEQRRKAAEAREQQRESHRQSREETQRDLEKQKQRNLDEYQKRQNIRHQHQEIQLQKHGEMRDKRQQQQSKLKEEQKHVLEEFRKQQSIDIESQQQALHERSTQHMKMRLEEEEQVSQVLQRQQEKSTHLKQAYQVSQHAAEGEDIEQKRESRDQLLQQHLQTQQDEDKAVEQKVLSALQKRQEIQKRQAEEITKPAGGSQPPPPVMTAEEGLQRQKQNAELEEKRVLKVLQQSAERKLAHQNLATEQSKTLLQEQQEKRKLQQEDRIRKQRDDDRLREEQVQHILSRKEQQRLAAQQHDEAQASQHAALLPSLKQQQEKQRLQNEETLRKQQEKDRLQREQVERLLQDKQKQKEQITRDHQVPIQEQQNPEKS